MARSRSSRDGYGWHHQQTRKQLLPYAYGKPCVRCGKPMMQGQQLELDHTDDRAGYLGMAHMRCNRAAGARKVNAARRNKKDPRSREW